ncbi:S-adenosyl-L-methionine-dependent methyltransferase [Boeremia exigua]|uniref:S-adenosyl-L-methionine-dependent methyltransferase n=1 Tax=Boeremia exigua TaxID=749465 RepID=UPI001E8CD0A9|nr:S-adenosyl-L-methionine-dependent methyltransferase [Boeremia exigua]KAH6641978.1 S-adenosyl-L-methionine-dependent methyltransferase [Boeremia exigua]
MNSNRLARQSEPTFHSESSSKYFLPNDATERHRLRKQHEAIVAFMHDEPIHAPLSAKSDPTKIFDLGCGVNASMTLLLAKRFPSATVYGVDLSDIDIDNKPDNVTFIQGDIHKLIANDPRLAPGSADYIYSRFMAAGVNDWSEHVKSISTLLAPGGFLELHESIRATWRDSNDVEISRDWQWLQLMHPGMFWPSNDPTGLDFFQSLARNAGLENVQGKVYKLSPSDKPEAQLWSAFARDLFPTSWVAPIQRLLPGEENRARRKELQDELFETLKPREGVYFPCVVVWGQRATSS